MFNHPASCFKDIAGSWWGAAGGTWWREVVTSLCKALAFSFELCCYSSLASGGERWGRLPGALRAKGVVAPGALWHYHLGKGVQK